MNNPPTAQELKSLLSYCYETGELKWSKRRCGVKAGSVAGTNHKGYLRIKIDGSLYLAHRVVWAMHYGSWPEIDLDHVDRDRRNNRIDNLRMVDRSQSCVNREYPHGESGIRGVSKHKCGWQAAITMYGKTQYIGLFKTVEEAEAARKGAEAILHKGFTPKNEGNQK